MLNFKQVALVFFVLAFVGIFFKEELKTAYAIAVVGERPEWKTQLFAQLLDPDSAKLRDVVETDIGFTCGYVNSRNSFGGYVGWQEFIIYRDSVSKKWKVLLHSPEQVKINRGYGFSNTCDLAK